MSTLHNQQHNSGNEIVQVQVTPAEELRARAARLQEMMQGAGFEGMMVTHNADVFYLSGAVQQAQLYLPLEGRPVLMVRKHPGRAASSSALDDGSVVAVRSLRELPALIVGAGPAPKRIGFLFDTLPVLTYQAYQKALAPLNAELGDASMLVRRARAIKSEFEVEQIRRAADVADAGVQAAAEHLREGATEVEVAARVEAALRVAGHSGTLRIRFYGQEMHMGHLLAGVSGAVPSFMNSPTGGYGQGPWAPYGAGARTIKRGEPVFLDYCGEWGGYIADQTRMLSIGRLSSFWLDAYAAMREVQDHLAREVRPGTASGQVFDMAVERATQLGYGDNFMGPPEEESPGQRMPFVGHGVGLELDEWPPLQRGTDAPLDAGMVLAIEPKLLFTGRGAIGIEDTYLLTEGGMVPLTHSSRDIVEVG
ncbi:MAG TPA: Xaa-Pro peptidase family protein [Chloroflexia bacterium]|nr:Xaa-Pro peptidase family protein [Chloroflexia bacterium]